VLLTIAAVANASDGEKSSARRGGAASGLRSPDPAQVAAAIEALGKRGDRAAIEALVGFVRAGQPDALADRALLALGASRSPSALPALADFTRHRRAAARVAAYSAAARIPGETANRLLGAGLRDSAPDVRGLCARSLGERGAQSQLDLLFRAFERGVPDASFAVGKLADRASLPRFDQQLGRLPIQVMLAGYEQFLLRADFDEATKLELIADLGEVASLTVKRFLERLLDAHDWTRQPRLQRAIIDTARRIEAKPSAASTSPAPIAVPVAEVKP
jgi:HEAT repeat protein